VRPALKPFLHRRYGDHLLLVRDVGDAFELPDPDGQIETLAKLLDGTRTPVQVTAEIRTRWPDLTEPDVRHGIAALDAAGLLEDADAGTGLSEEELTRYTSGLNFFSTFATLDRSRYSFQERLRDAHVVLLGVGGLGSSVLLGMAGSGVGRITLLDTDRVELKNLTRQFLYVESDVGKSKVWRAAARARAANGTIQVDAVDRRVSGPADIAPLVEGADLVVCGIDQPMASRYWVNEACVAAGVPWIGGGMTVTRLVYWSVWPGRSGCLVCRDVAGLGPEAGEVAGLGTAAGEVAGLGTAAGEVAGLGTAAGEVAGDLRRWRTNRTIGPMASVVAGYVGLEALRYLTGFAPPVAAARSWLVDVVTGTTALELAWDRHPGCPVCGGPDTSGAQR
jgi:molybdopterin/thiamine biosynthesis adenylyltransferase